MKCLVCGGAPLCTDTRDVRYEYRGSVVTVPNVTGEFCPDCGEVYLDASGARRFSRMTRALQNRGCAAAARQTTKPAEKSFVAHACWRLGRNIPEMAATLGYDVKQFNEYADGTSPPPQVLVGVLRILMKRPHLLREFLVLQEER